MRQRQNRIGDMQQGLLGSFSLRGKAGALCTAVGSGHWMKQKQVSRSGPPPRNTPCEPISVILLKMMSTGPQTIGDVVNESCAKK